MKIVVGIGNPGAEYEGTRHNVGFDTLDAVARQAALNPGYRSRFQALVALVTLEDQSTLLVKPQTYVNLSGQAVRAALDWYKELVDNLLVVCDDLHLPLGRIRVRRSGSSGGHKGLKSIEQALSTNEFARLRIGIGEPVGMTAVDFVLSRFAPHERPQIEAAVERAAQAVRCWVRAGVDACMNEFNAAPKAESGGAS